MRKQFLILGGAVVLMVYACSKTAKEEEVADEAVTETNVAPESRACVSHQILEEQLAADPKRRERLYALERFTEEFVKNPSAFKLLADGSIEIPVHVNVLYRTASENISDAQIQSQIDVLNEDFGGYNADFSKINNTIFAQVAAGNTKIKFSWDPATGVTRKATNKTSWRTNDDMKRSSRGGIDPTSPTTKLNIWVCNLSNSILGYAQFPGGNPATDGVVIDNNAFGRGNYNLFSAFNLGRTATHEVGHWLNLRHIWGDATCGNDFVDDTPQHNASNGGCPTYPHYSTCAGTPIEMTMNYMDYTNDACMYVFSKGQAARMWATFASGAGRNSFAQP